MKKLFVFLLVISQTAVSMEESDLGSCFLLDTEEQRSEIREALNSGELNINNFSLVAAGDDENGNTLHSEIPNTSWMSLLTSPINGAFENACGVVKYIKHSPQKAMIIGFLVTANFVSATAQNCTACYRCSCYCGNSDFYVGKASSLWECAQVCNISKLSIYACKG